MADNDILLSIAAEVARVEAEIRAKETERDGLKRAEESIRMARGTTVGSQVAQVVPLPESLERRARPRTQVPVDGIAPATPVSADIASRVREILEERLAKVHELASMIGTTLQLMQDTLDSLQASGQVLRFDDGAYVWCVGPNVDAERCRAVIKRLLIGRWITREHLLHVFRVLPDDDKNAKRLVDNPMYEYFPVREELWSNPSWADRSKGIGRGHPTLYAIFPGQKPPREMDGRKPKRVRVRAAKRAASDGAQRRAQRPTQQRSRR